MFFFSDFVVSLFVDATDIRLLELATHALKLFSLTYSIRWFSIAAQSFLSAIEKPLHATILSLCVALIFPVIMLGTLWNLGLDGIWLNMPGTAILAAILAVFLIVHVQKNITKPKKTS